MSDKGAKGTRDGRSGRPLGCADVRDLLPLRAAGALPLADARLLERHLGDCADCADEAQFIAQLRALRPAPPVDFAARVVRSIADDRNDPEPLEIAVGGGASFPRSASWGWGLALAASLVVAVGVGVLSHDGSAPNREALLSTLVEGTDEQEREEWMVAGAPVWEALPEAVLMGLLVDEDI